MKLSISWKTAVALFLSVSFSVLGQEPGMSEQAAIPLEKVINPDGTLLLKCAESTFNPPAETYNSAQDVTINNWSTGTTIHYTTNGNDPTERDAVYTEPVHIASTTMLKAKAFKTGYTPSEIVSGIYKIMTNFITVTSPNGGENWQGGSVHNITWTDGRAIHIYNVYIDYSTDIGANWTNVAETSDDGTYEWTVPNISSIHCLVRVSDQPNGGGPSADQSDWQFTISQTPFIMVSSPNGGGIYPSPEEWQAGSVHDITWTSYGTSGTVKIDYSTNYGSTWTTVIASTPDDGTYPWTVPNTPSTTCLVRVADTDGSPTDQSDWWFMILPAPFITLSSPYSGENWQVGSSHNITWTSIGTSGTVNVDYSTDKGATWIPVIASTPDDGTHPWTIPNTPSAYCVVRVTDTDGSPTDHNHVLFTISPVPFISVSSPNGGENWQVGSVHNITWTSIGTSGTVKIDFSTDKGSTWPTVIASTPDDGTYLWNVPNTPSANCLVRVTDTDGSPTDYSNAVFTVSAPFITVGSPNGGENWLVGSSHNITWTSGGTSGTVNVDYSTDNGSTWAKVSAGTPDDGTQPWTVPDTPSANCLVRVADPDMGLTEQSNAVFTISQIPFITIGSPNGGENWPVGSTQNINWTSGGTSGTVKIDYSTDNGSTWIAVIASTPDDGTHSWTVPNTPSANCLVRVADTDGNPTDQSNAVFTISQASFITVVSPNGGEFWQVSSVHDITWTSGGTSGTVRIDYSTDNGSAWTTVIASTPDDGTHPWTVPNTPSINCLIRVADTDGNPTDQSNAVFTISQASFITVVSPNGGEFWQGVIVHNIIWTSSGTSGTVKIDYSTDKGSNWTTVIASTPDDGTHSWTVPNTPSTNCLIRIADTDGSPTDQSNAVFTIPASFITVGSPNGGENWPIGSGQNITWITNVPLLTGKIDYSTDNGSTWITVIASTPDAGTYLWTIPNTPSANCLVRVVGRDGSLTDQSNAVFTISQAPFITVGSPNGGEIWQVGNVHDITWTSGGTSGTVKIDYSTDKGSTWTTVIASTPDNGTYPWTIPNTPSTNCLVRVADTHGSPTDQSNAVFTISHVPYAYMARQVNSSQKPVLDGNLDDAVWSAVNSDTLARGGKNDAFNQTWSSFLDNLVTWKAVWSKEDNKLYVGVNVVDDVRGTDDNDNGSPNHVPWQDDSIEFYTNGDHSGGAYDTYEAAQLWRVTTKNNRNLFPYPNDPYHVYIGYDFMTFVKLADNGNWTIEAEFAIYDKYSSVRRNLKLGDVIGWDVWYNDSDNKTLTNGYYARDVQTGWRYAGPAYANADYFGDLVLGGPVDITSVAERNDVLSKSFEVGSNYPNPFNGETMVEFGLPQAGKVGAEVYNMLGEKIRVLSAGRECQPGTHKISWDGRDHFGRAVTSGMYFIRVQYRAEARLIKAMVLR
jgi:hypothetical protein